MCGPKEPNAVYTPQCLQPSQFRASEHGPCRDSGKAFETDRVWSADVYNFTANRVARSRLGWRQHATHDCVSIAPGILGIRKLSQGGDNSRRMRESARVNRRPPRVCANSVSLCQMNSRKFGDLATQDSRYHGTLLKLVSLGRIKTVHERVPIGAESWNESEQCCTSDRNKHVDFDT